MPLAFETKNRETVAFGFFNIETDMLLLEHYFFFASDFCEKVARMAEEIRKGVSQWRLKGFDIADVSKIGDLHGAIRGEWYVGFIGEVYRHFPFPDAMEEFKQNPEGFRTREVVENLIRKYGEPLDIPLGINEKKKDVVIGNYSFSYPEFQALIRYVWRGGYPLWKNDTRPRYVMEMKEIIEKNPYGPFENLDFSLPR